MTQKERREFLIRYLLSENPRYSHYDVPKEEGEQRAFLRSLMNVRMPGEIEDSFLQVQDAYLQTVREEKGVVTLADMEELQEGIYLWQGDITRLQVGGIVNAANSGMTGCYSPCHNCIDNCIHTYAGVQLRNYCDDIMKRQGYPEPTGQAKITPAFNLPCDFVLHTVGPIVSGRLKPRQEVELCSSYRNCMELASENHLKSLAFCCISTGVFGFPADRASELAVETVKDYRHLHPELQVVFNVFKDSDKELYENLLRDRTS